MDGLVIFATIERQSLFPYNKFNPSNSEENNFMAQNNIVNVTSPAKPDSTEEHIIGVIPTAYKWTILGAKQWFDIIVTDRRLVFALLKDNFSYRDDYSGRRMDEILAENKKNIPIEIGRIKSFKYVPGRGINELCGKYQEIDGQINIRTPEAKYFFYVPYRYDRVAREMLTKTGLYSNEKAPEVFRGI
jgi:hypothetical protein